MQKTKKSIFCYSLRLLYFVFWLSVFFIIPSYAYVDPATTAMLTQIIAGLFISAGVLFGIFRRKIIMFFKNISIKLKQRKIEKQNKKTR